MKHTLSSRLNSRITVQTSTVSHDAFGGPISEWEDAFSCYAEVKALRGMEDYKTDLETSVTRYKITVRWRSGIDAKCRIVLADGKTLNVNSVYDPTGRRECIEIIATHNTAEEANNVDYY